jgi:hypothetical protein
LHIGSTVLFGMTSRPSDEENGHGDEYYFFHDYMGFLFFQHSSRKDIKINRNEHLNHYIQEHDYREFNKFSRFLAMA